MSSILDALQKVEREKGRAEEPQDLDELLDAIDEDELVAANLLGRPPEPTFPRWLPAAGAATALLIGLSAAAVAYYPQIRNPRDPSREPVRTQLASRQPSQPEAGRTVAQAVRPEPAAGPESGARPTPAPEMEPRPEPAPHVQPTDSSPVAPPLPATSQPDATVQEAAPETGVEAAPVAPPPPPNAAPRIRRTRLARGWWPTSSRRIHTRIPQERICRRIRGLGLRVRPSKRRTALLRALERLPRVKLRATRIPPWPSGCPLRSAGR